MEGTIGLSDDPERMVTILLTRTLQDGTSSADYSGVPDSVTLNSGDTSISFTFSATQDSVDDAWESVKLTFGTLPTGVTAGTPTVTTFSIIEGMAVSFDMADYVATEGGPDATVTVELSAPAPRQVDIPLTAEGRSGAIPTDWSGVPEQLTFNAGDTEKTFSFTAVQDDDENTETGVL